jgi:hypothetical protein
VKRIIHYTHTTVEYPPTEYDDDGNATEGKPIYAKHKLSIESDNDKDFNEQLEAIKTYCKDWKVEEVKE